MLYLNVDFKQVDAVIEAVKTGQCLKPVIILLLLVSLDWHWFVGGKQSGDFWESRELIRNPGRWVSDFYFSYAYT